MTIKLQLSEADRIRFGCGEWLEFDFRRLAATEAATIQAKTQRPVLDVLRGLTAGTPVLDQRGAPVPKLDKHGAPVVLDDGSLVFQTLADIDAQIAVVWVALRRAGRPHTWEAVGEMNVLELRVDWGPGEDDPAGPAADAGAATAESPGKADHPEPIPT